MLKHGCIGEDVKELKKALAKHGYDDLTLTNGNFYSLTRNTVKAFQRDKGLTVDGIVGPKTFENWEYSSNCRKLKLEVRL